MPKPVRLLASAAVFRLASCVVLASFCDCDGRSPCERRAVERCESVRGEHRGPLDLHAACLREARARCREPGAGP
ncbi:MAG: hypothetical protein MJE66_03480 [Proteobacteria bacterium]|nr:hypothetical protein [Pseudomonadota bacterium]